MRNHERISMEGRVAGAVEDLTAATGWQFASIRLLRAALPDIPREDLDEVLIGLYTAQIVNLIPQSNQQALTKADRAAAVRCGGEDKHLLAWVNP